MSRFGVGHQCSCISAPMRPPSEGMGKIDLGTISKVGSVAMILDKELGVTKSIGDGLSAEGKIPAVGKAISDQMKYVTINILGYPLNSREQLKCFFRLGELLAKADPLVKKKGYAYAGYGNNSITTEQEGGDFTANGGGRGKATGLEDRLNAGEVLGVRYEVGRMGEKLAIFKSVLETVTRFRVALESISSISIQVTAEKTDEITGISAKRAAFGAALKHYLVRSGDPRVGMGFLGFGATLPPEFFAIMDAPRGRPSSDDSISLGEGGGGDAPKKEGMGVGTILAVVGAAVGAYFIAKS